MNKQNNVKDKREERTNDKLNHRVVHWRSPAHPGECQNGQTSKTQGTTVANSDCCNMLWSSHIWQS